LIVDGSGLTGGTTPEARVFTLANGASGIDEGRAMLEIVHDVAPAAGLMFATANLGQAGFAANIGALVAAGADVVIDDIVYFDEPYFQDGVIAQAVDDATAAGASYFAAAYNFGRQSYESPFRAGAALAAGAFPSVGVAPAFRGGVPHDFDPGVGVDTRQQFTLQNGEAIHLGLQWDDPFFSVSGGPGARSDVDIYVLDAAGNVVGGRTSNNVGQDPVERFAFQNTTGGTANFELMIVSHPGGGVIPNPAPGFVKYVDFVGQMTAVEHDTDSGTAFGHANSATGNNVGAARWTNTPSNGVDPPVIEGFSSAGGIGIRFDTDGNRIGPIVRQNPNIVAPDDANTTFFGRDIPNDQDDFPNFPGTSAAAPHAGALAALMLQLNPDATPEEIKEALEATAIDMDDPNSGGFDGGFDTGTGYGLVQALPALLAVHPGEQFEPNDTLGTATVLGSLPEITLQDLTIEAGDTDLFRVTAHETGKLLVNTVFAHQLGDLDLRVRDRNSNILGSSVSVTDNEQIVLPVVGQEVYYIEVFGATGGAVNLYDLEIENFAAPVPDAVVLDPSDDDGWSSTDNLTCETTPRILIEADLASFADDGINILTPTEVGNQEDGAAVEVFINGSSVGYATAIAGTDNTLFQYDIETGELSSTFVPVPGGGGLNFVKAAVRIFDGQEDIDGNPDPADDRTLQSEPLLLTLDTTAPDASVPDLLASSDTGTFDDDNVTRINQPAFTGVAEANARVRVYADGLLVGEGMVGKDATHATEGLGVWEITVEALDDGIYEITTIVDDPACNLSEISESLRIEIDTTVPNTPWLDLLADDDSGRSNEDNITNVSEPRLDSVVEDPNGPDGHLFPTENIVFRIFDRFENQAEVAVYSSGPLHENNSFRNGVDLLLIKPETIGDENDGLHGLKLEVEDRAGNISPDFLLEILLDRVARRSRLWESIRVPPIRASTAKR
jgi:hypothetical protein